MVFQKLPNLTHSKDHTPTVLLGSWSNMALIAVSRDLSSSSSSLSLSPPRSSRRCSTRSKAEVSDGTVRDVSKLAQQPGGRRLHKRSGGRWYGDEETCLQVYLHQAKPRVHIAKGVGRRGWDNGAYMAGPLQDFVITNSVMPADFVTALYNNAYRTSAWYIRISASSVGRLSLNNRVRDLMTAQARPIRRVKFNRRGPSDDCKQSFQLIRRFYSPLKHCDGLRPEPRFRSFVLG